jgi:hypothetical protein
MTGIDPVTDRCREQQSAAFLQLDEAIAPSRVATRNTAARNGDQAAAVGKRRQRRRNVPERGVGDAAIDMRRHRKRWVHQHDGRMDVSIEMMVNVRRVIPSDADAAEQLVEQTCACVSELVEMQLRASELGMNR